MVSLRIAVLVMCLILALSQAQAQTTRCDTACANDVSCSSNQCVLTSCSDTSSCYQYCLRCNDIQTCYGTGPSCPVTVTQLNSSNQFRVSLILTVSSLIILWITK